MRCMVSVLAVTILVMTALVSAAPPHEVVRTYQAFLRQQGYDPGPVNGIMSSKTMTAIQQFRRQAETGGRRAQYYVGHFYIHGVGVPKNLTEAAKWYRRAAERGLNEAQYELGKLYARGAQDVVRAYAWFYVAAQGANKAARKRLRDIETRLTSSQRRQALELGKKLFAVCTTSGAQ